MLTLNIEFPVGVLMVGVVESRSIKLTLESLVVVLVGKSGIVVVAVGIVSLVNVIVEDGCTVVDGESGIVMRVVLVAVGSSVEFLLTVGELVDISVGASVLVDRLDDLELNVVGWSELVVEANFTNASLELGVTKSDGVVEV